MLPEYLSYWGFRKPPFSLTPDPSMLYLGTQHQEALLRLKYGVLSNKGGVLLVSENAGDGKTSILRRLMEDLKQENKNRIRIAFIDHPTLTVNQMVAEIARQLGVSRVRKEKIDNLNALRLTLTDLHEKGVKSLVIVDEGQMLAHKPDILQELRILLNFCVADAFLLSFVFSGQKPLEDAVKRMPEFWQRLPVRFFLRNLDLKDTAGVIRHRVSTAGQTQRDIFTPTAIEGIYRASQGCPRVFCSIADLALLVGHSLRSQNVDFRELAQATSDMTRSGEAYHYFSFIATERKKPRRRRQCPGCRRFVAARDEACPRCGRPIAAEAPAAEPAAAPPAAEAKIECPGCRQQVAQAARCAHCGLLLSQACPRCQQSNSVEGGSCARCGCRLTGRDALATREFEHGLRRLGIKPPAVAVVHRFPALESEGRVYVGCVEPRLPWGRKSRLEAWDATLEGSFFVAERAFVFASGSGNRRIPYAEIRNLSIAQGERYGRVALPRMRIVLDKEELRLVFPVRTERPAEFASLVASFVTNRKLSGSA